MKSKQVEQISAEVDSWIEESEFPVSVCLKPIRQFDGLFPEDEEEREAYWEFIKWAMNRDHQVLLSIQVKDNDCYFVPFELDENGNDISPFNTMDFKRLSGFKFNYEHWKLKETMQRLRDLAQSHSCIGDGKCAAACRANIKRIFDEIVEVDFKDKYYLTGQIKYMIRAGAARKIWADTAYDT